MHVCDNYSTNSMNLKNNVSMSFKAMPVAKYKAEGMKDNVVYIYQLERKDYPFIKNFLNNIQNYFKEKGIHDYSRQEVMNESFAASEKLLSSPDSIVGKTKMLIAVAKKNICGIIIGNVPKQAKNKTIHYSSRKNHKRYETELDWLATWNVKSGQHIKGIGKFLTNEYFKTAKHDGFRNVYVRSEVPELSYAQKFYERMGFSELPNKRDSISKTSNNKYMIGDYDASGEEIVPMVASRGEINKTIKDVSKEYKRKNLYNKNVELENIL